MDKRSLFFGVGIGILCTVAIVFIVYQVQRNVFLREINELRAASIELANEDFEEETIEIFAAEPEILFTNEPEYDIIEEVIEIFEQEIAQEFLEEDLEIAEEIDEETEEVQEYALVDIPFGLDSFTISNILESSGVVADATEFLNFARSNNFTTTILAGSFELPINGDFEEIARIIVLN